MGSFLGHVVCACDPWTGTRKGNQRSHCTGSPGMHSHRARGSNQGSRSLSCGAGRGVLPLHLSGWDFMRHFSQSKSLLPLKGASHLCTHLFHLPIPSITHSTHLTLWAISAPCSGAESKPTTTAICYFSKHPACSKSHSRAKRTKGHTGGREG